MAVMTNKDFIKKLKEIENLPTTYYSVAGGKWACWNGKSWNFDCVILVKAILWGWNGDKNHSHGGADYASNGVRDDNADQIMERCSNVTTNFGNIVPGELLWMPGHVGVYVGDGKVIECTAAWEGKVVYSDINSQGKRSRNGKTVGYWKKHGYLKYIEYLAKDEESKPAATPKPVGEKFKKGDRVIVNGHLYKDSQGNGQGKYLSSYRGTITLTADGPKPYHIGTLGWVSEDSLRIVEANKDYRTITNCTWLNLRTSPEYGDNVYKSVRAGTKVEYLGMENGWAKVDYNGKKVYCGASYLK